LEEGKSGWVGNKKGIEKWKNRKYIVFSHICLFGRIEKWRDGKNICLVEKKYKSIENIVCINLLS